MTKALASILTAMLVAGCASSAPTTGLANAPKLGTSPSRARPPYDVVADGRDSCEREATAKPPSWSRSPPCEPAPVLEPAPPAAPPPERPWVPRSRWTLPACRRADAGEVPLLSSCCDPVGRDCLQ